MKLVGWLRDAGHVNGRSFGMIWSGALAPVPAFAIAELGQAASQALARSSVTTGLWIDADVRVRVGIPQGEALCESWGCVVASPST